MAVAAFFGTRVVAGGNEALRRRQAAAWFDKARQTLRGGDVEVAVWELRRAVSKDPGNKSYRLALAAALAANRLDDEAERVLLVLREAEPEDPQTNLQLARLEARGGDADATRRYYQSALSALWRPAQAPERRRVQSELIEFLLAHQERARALSELIVLAASLPEDAAVQTRVGRMFLAAGEPRLALDHFVRAVGLDSNNPDASAGAGQAAFELADYSRALRYLNGASPEDTLAAGLRQVVRLVLDSDPLAPRLGPDERRRRLSAAYQQAVERLDTCLNNPLRPAGTTLGRLRDEVHAVQTVLELPPRRQPRDLLDDGIELVYRVERAADEQCGTPPGPVDRALELIGRRHGFEDQ